MIEYSPSILKKYYKLIFDPIPKDIKSKIIDMMACGRIEFLSNTNNRMAFLTKSKNYVLKVPSTEKGLHDNWNENDYWLLAKKKNLHEKYAKCRMIYSNYILLMEYVQDFRELNICVNSLPDWTKYVDCQQVGFTKSGRLVAYDYA